MIRKIIFLLALFIVIRLAMNETILTIKLKEDISMVIRLIQNNWSLFIYLITAGGIGYIMGIVAYNNRFLG